jgi:alkanesulfonate monooxygenase SsuD/methylene tetrahydromethanopterin reductase-like flavin-dependent oxidoreductase (luciferase family)
MDVTGGAVVKVGVGLPSCVPGCQPRLLTAWAAGAEDAGFASVGVVDRLRYGNYEPLVALAAAAAVTTTVNLVTSILIAPLREAASLAKQLATLDVLSGGRLTLGVAVGARRDDYELSEFGYAGRGARLDGLLHALRAHWEQDHLGPRPQQAGGPPLLVGGQSGPALVRMAAHADGYIHSGGPPRAFARAAEQARAAWTDAGRPGTPQLWGMAYFALGDTGDAEAGRAYLRDYYAFTGPFAQRIADGLLTEPLALREFLDGYADAGCDHLILFPTVADAAQLERLASAVA